MIINILKQIFTKQPVWNQRLEQLYATLQANKTTAENFLTHLENTDGTIKELEAAACIILRIQIALDGFEKEYG